MPRPPARRSSPPPAPREASDAPSRLLSSLPALPAASFDPLSPWGFSVVGWSCNPFDEGTSSQIPPATPHSTAPTSIPAPEPCDPSRLRQVLDADVQQSFRTIPGRSEERSLGQEC